MSIIQVIAFLFNIYSKVNNTFMNKNVWLIILFTLYGCRDRSNLKEDFRQPVSNQIPIIQYHIIERFSHDTSLFTEGLVFYNNHLYESTGSPKELPYTRSVIGSIDLPTGAFNKKIEIDKNLYFGEGIVFFKNKLYQVTYKNQKGFIYDAKTFKQIGSFNYKNKEGWGLTTDNESIIMSDGTDTLTYFDPYLQSAKKKLVVSENGKLVDNINELEYIKGYIYANVWMSNEIIKINPKNGNIVGKLDLSLLFDEAKYKKQNIDVLNGIAFDSISNKVYVTGKLWPIVYCISIEY